MIKVVDILDKLFETLPQSNCLEGDNVGLLCGNKNDAVSSVVTALDITDDTISYAKTVKANLIISHHPVIYYPLKSFTENDIAYKLAKANISSICMHTNLDFAEYGLNFLVAKKLGIKKPKKVGNIIIGMNKFKDLKAFCDTVKQVLRCKGLEIYSGGKNPANICIVTGAGGDYLVEAKSAGCDTFITGELKHHERILAASLGMNIVIAGHYETEFLAAEWFKNFLDDNFKGITVNTEPFKIKFDRL